MVENKIVEEALKKLRKSYDINIKSCVDCAFGQIISESDEEIKKQIKYYLLDDKKEKVMFLIKSFLEKGDMPPEIFDTGLSTCLMIISLLLEKSDLTAKEKKCVVFKYIDNSIKNGILEGRFLSKIPHQVKYQYYIINEYYLKKIQTGEIITFEDLFDLRVALLNLRVTDSVINEIFSDIKLDLNISSALENQNDSKLSPSIKKLINSVLDCSNNFIDGKSEIGINKKVFNFRRSFVVRNNLNLLYTIVFSKDIVTDFKLLSNILVLFKSEFNLKQDDFVNIIFDIIEKNISIGILEKDSINYPISKIPNEFLTKEGRYYTDIDDEFIDKFFEQFNMKDEKRKSSELIKKAHILLQNSYFNKKQHDGSLKDFSVSDLENIKNALKKLEVNEFVIDIIVQNLTHKVTKTVLKRVDKKKITNSEYKEYLEKLKTYIQIEEDLPTNEMIINSILIPKFLTIKDKEICVDLMEKLDFSEKVILEFLIKTEKDNIISKNIIAVYENEVKVWLNFYKEHDEYKEMIAYIEEVYKELCSCYIDYYKHKKTNSSASYREWCSILVEQINEFYLVIDSNKERSAYLLKRIRSKKEQKIN